MRALKFAAAVSLVSFLNLAGLVVIAGLVRMTAGAGPVATQNGDVNGDGLLNLADPVYLLTHLFSGGPAPVAIAGSPSTIAEEVETALARFLPRHSDRLSVRVDLPTQAEPASIAIVPAGKKLILTYAHAYTPQGTAVELRINGVREFNVDDHTGSPGDSPWGRTASSNSNFGASGEAVMILEAGDSLELFVQGVPGATTGGAYARVFGYWVDAP